MRNATNETFNILKNKFTRKIGCAVFSSDIGKFLSLPISMQLYLLRQTVDPVFNSTLILDFSKSGQLHPKIKSLCIKNVIKEPRYAFNIVNNAVYRHLAKGRAESKLKTKFNLKELEILTISAFFWNKDILNKVRGLFRFSSNFKKAISLANLGFSLDNVLDFYKNSK